MTSLANHLWFQDPALRRVLDLLNDPPEPKDGVGTGATPAETRVVGGAVRNSLLGQPVGDVDLATTLVPEAVIQRARVAGIKTVPTGLSHGTVTLIVAGKPFEVTTLRRDVSTNGRHAEVVFGADWQADAERRDFTVNALYCDRHGRVIDPVGGLADLETGTIRFIGDARARIAEDYLRVLRFFRFFAWYGRGRPDADGLRAAAAARNDLAALSAERVWAELKKLLQAPDPGRALLWMRQSGVLTALVPETEKWGIDAIPGLIATEQALGWRPDPLLRLAAIIPDDPDRRRTLATRLRLSRAETETLVRHAEAPRPPMDIADIALDRMLYHHGRTGLIIRLKLALASARQQMDADPTGASVNPAGGEAQAMIAALAGRGTMPSPSTSGKTHSVAPGTLGSDLVGGRPGLSTVGRLSALLARAEAYEKPSFPLTGADIMATGIDAGPEVGRLLSALTDVWIDAGFSLDRDRLLAKLKEFRTGSDGSP